MASRTGSLHHIPSSRVASAVSIVVLEQYRPLQTLEPWGYRLILAEAGIGPGMCRDLREPNSQPEGRDSFL
jgi:hypothetical protein